MIAAHKVAEYVSELELRFFYAINVAQQVLSGEYDHQRCKQYKIA